MVFGNEAMAVTEMDIKRLDTWKRKILRKIYVQVVEQGIWKIRNDQELRELYKDLDIVADNKRKRLEWTGRVVKMDQGRRVKKISES